MLGNQTGGHLAFIWQYCTVKVAAYQAPLLPSGSNEALGLIRGRVASCEAASVSLLCCPEAIHGGLADQAARPADFALHAGNGELETALNPLASATVTTIVGFTERDDAGKLYNTAVVYHRGAVLGLYRKRHPAIRKSVYSPGDDSPVFTVGGLVFGILICNDSNFPALASALAARGARALFVPTNNALPPDRPELVSAARAVDIALAQNHSLTIIRADVAGIQPGLVAHGSSAIVAPDGRITQVARRLTEDLLVAELP